MAHLKISDIDSTDGHSYRAAKERKDRDVMLSPKLLDALRIYWPRASAQATTGCFRQSMAYASHPVSTKVLWSAVSRPPNAPALSASAFIPIPCATALPLHLLEAGADLRTIQMLLVIVTWKKRPSICISPGGISAATGSPLDALTIRGEETAAERMNGHSGGGRHRSLCRTVLH